MKRTLCVLCAFSISRKGFYIINENYVMSTFSNSVYVIAMNIEALILMFIHQVYIDLGTT
jgi:membrane-anchored glycerophosphoryl diester phosphodiesterase (GDPDase)